MIALGLALLFVGAAGVVWGNWRIHYSPTPNLWYGVATAFNWLGIFPGIILLIIGIWG